MHAKITKVSRKKFVDIYKPYTGGSEQVFKKELLQECHHFVKKWVDLNILNSIVTVITNDVHSKLDYEVLVA